MKIFKRVAQAFTILASATLLLLGAIFIRSQGVHADFATSTPVISNVEIVASSTNATITWNTNAGATSQVAYGTTTGYGSFSILDATAQTSHLSVLSGLSASTTYHFYIISSGTGTSTTATTTDFQFTTLPIATSTGTTTTSNLDIRVFNLETRVTNLENSVQYLLNLINQIGTSTQGGGSGTTTSNQPASVDVPQPVRAGTTVDFGGHNFASEEHINVMRGGVTVGSAFTNLAGGFSTGSMAVPNTPGTYIYTFVGVTSGKNISVTLTVIP